MHGDKKSTQPALKESHNLLKLLKKILVKIGQVSQSNS